MARINNLTNFLTDVASAIKTKTGDSTAIPASQFDTKIANITTGHLDNTEYEEANDDLDDILEGSTPVTIYPPDWSEIGYEETPQNIIDGFNYAKEIKDNWDSSQTNLAQKFYNYLDLIYAPLVNTSNATDMSGMFYGCSNLSYIPILNTSNVANMSTMFYQCIALKSIPLLDTSNVTNMFAMFQGCKLLENIPVFDLSKCNNMWVMFQNCTKISNDSLNNIMQMCLGATSYTGTKTLKEIGLTSAQATTCQSLSNYQAFLAAGWTTGY